MTTPKTAPKPRTRILIFVLQAIAVILVIDIMMHWASFKQGLREGWHWAAPK